MKKILFIATTNLHVRYGGSLATLAYYNALRYHYGSGIALAMPEEFCYDIYEKAIPIPPRSKWNSYINLLKGKFHRYKDFVFQHLKEHAKEYNLAIINGGFYAGDMINILHSYGIRVLVIHHNYEPEYHMDNRTLPTLGGITPLFVAHNERNSYKNADLNAFLTKADINLHQQHYGNCNKAPFLLGVFEPEPSKSNAHLPTCSLSNVPKNIVITGSMNSVQTIRGIMNFKQHYFPILRKSLPEWKIIIAGRNPDKSIMQFAADNQNCIQVIPNPDNMNDVIATGNVFLCPTHVGGGLKLRLMDGLKNGLPVLVHSISARGYDAFEGKPFFQIYDNKESFEQGLHQISKFIQNNSNYNETIQNLYNTTFSFEAGCKRVAEMIESLL